MLVWQDKSFVPGRFEVRKVLMLMVLWFGLLSAPALAGGVIWDCDFPENKASSGGWADGRVVVQMQEGAAEAIVNSAVIMHFIGKPVTAMVVTDKPEQLVLSWEVEANNKSPEGHQYTRMKYKLNIVRGGALATYFAQPLAYDNKWRNEGKCRRGKG